MKFNISNILKENERAAKVQVKGGADYTMVCQRNDLFHKFFPCGSIIVRPAMMVVKEKDAAGNTRKVLREIELDGNEVMKEALLFDNEGNFLANGYAYESQGNGANQCSWDSNCSTSAVGKAMQYIGLGVKPLFDGYNATDMVDSSLSKEDQIGELLTRANACVKPVDVRGGNYAEVDSRILAFRMVYPKGCTYAYILEYSKDAMKVEAQIYASNEGFVVPELDEEVPVQKIRLLAKDQNKKLTASGQLAKNSLVEFTTTAALGRGLAFAGFASSFNVASSDEMQSSMQIERLYLSQSCIKAKLEEMQITEDDLCKALKIESIKGLDNAACGQVMTFLEKNEAKRKKKKLQSMLESLAETKKEMERESEAAMQSAAAKKAETSAPTPEQVKEESTKFVSAPKKKAKPDTPAPVKEEKPAAESAPAPAKEEAPAPVKEEVPAPVKEETPEPVQEESPAPVKEEAPTPVKEEVSVLTEEAVSGLMETTYPDRGNSLLRKGKPISQLSAHEVRWLWQNTHSLNVLLACEEKQRSDPAMVDSSGNPLIDVSAASHNARVSEIEKAQ